MNSQDSLWQFALAYYQRPAVAELCLELQDQWGADVCLLLWCLWLERQDVRLDSERLQEVHARFQPWRQQVVEPLRQLRRQLKHNYGTADGDIEALRQQVKQVELHSEKLLLQWLAAQDTSRLAPGCTPGANLLVYAQWLGLPAAWQQRLQAWVSS